MRQILIKNEIFGGSFLSWIDDFKTVYFRSDQHTPALQYQASASNNYYNNTDAGNDLEAMYGRLKHFFDINKFEDSGAAT